MMMKILVVVCLTAYTAMAAPPVVSAQRQLEFLHVMEHPQQQDKEQAHYGYQTVTETHLDPALFQVDAAVWERLHFGHAALPHESSPLPVHVRTRHLSVAHEYNASCANNDLLYGDVDHKGYTCECEPDRFPGYHRIVCMMVGADCTTFAACVGQGDIWIFQEGSGQLISRSTCLPCVDSANNCRQWRDLCINAEFHHDTNDMEDCTVIMNESEPPLVCDNCQPCIPDHGENWGMQFSCFDIVTNGCTDGARIALHPFDQDGPTPGVATPGGGTSTNETPKNNNGGGTAAQSSSSNMSSEDNDDTLILVIVLMGTVNAILLCAVLMGIVCCMRQRKKQQRQANDATEGVFKTNNDTAPHNLDVTAEEEDATQGSMSPTATSSGTPPAYYMKDNTTVVMEDLADDHNTKDDMDMAQETVMAHPIA